MALMKCALWVGLAFFMISSSAIASDEAGKGFDAFMRGDYETALRVLRPLAEQGDGGAELALGYVYEKGKGIQDYAEAFKWYRRAAERGVPVAAVALGTLYAEGNGTPQNYQEAKFWFEKAAADGVPSGQRSMGTMYFNGAGVRRTMRWR